MNMTEPDDYDTPWKEILENYFQEFIAFFFPDADADIDWTQGYEFLDKELQQITRDAEAGRKYVDKLARVWRKAGTEAWALIHTDIQVRREQQFDERMYTYNYRLYDRYRRHAASFAVISGEGNWSPGAFEQDLWGCEVKFRFPVASLSAFARNPDALEKSRNPFAVVVMAHLQTQATASDRDRRMREKLVLVKNLYRRGYSRQDIIHLFRFIDWIMALPEELNNRFWDDLAEYEKESKMPYVTSVERIGYKKGRQEGKEEGIQEGKQQGRLQYLSEMIGFKFGADAEQKLFMLKRLTSDELLELGMKLPELDSIEAVQQWISDRLAIRKEQ